MSATSESSLAVSSSLVSAYTRLATHWESTPRLRCPWRARLEWILSTFADTSPARGARAGASRGAARRGCRQGGSEDRRRRCLPAEQGVAAAPLAVRLTEDELQAALRAELLEGVVAEGGVHLGEAVQSGDQVAHVQQRVVGGHELHHLLRARRWSEGRERGVCYGAVASGGAGGSFWVGGGADQLKICWPTQ
jgi:hypothetical protein